MAPGVEAAHADASASQSACAAIGSGVAHAHSLNVILRDVKPGNCLVFDDGVARLADFELAGTIEELRRPRREAAQDVRGDAGVRRARTAGGLRRGAGAQFIG